MAVDGVGESVAHKSEFPHASPRASCVDSHRQHIGGIVHKPPRRSALDSPSRDGSLPFAVGRPPSAFHSGSTYPGLFEQRRRYVNRGTGSLMENGD